MQRKSKPDLPPATDAITAPVDKFCGLSGLGKNTVYQMIGDGRLASIKIGRRRLVVVELLPTADPGGASRAAIAAMTARARGFIEAWHPRAETWELPYRIKQVLDVQGPTGLAERRNSQGGRQKTDFGRRPNYVPALEWGHRPVSDRCGKAVIVLLCPAQLGDLVE